MKIHEQQQNDILDDITQMLEKESGKKIFTMRVIEDRPEDSPEDEIAAIVVFEDKSILNAVIHVETIHGKMAVRLKGNYI